MKSEDFERLKAVCEKEGFDVLNLTHDDNEKYVLVKKAKDKWEGVEFVESIWSGKIFPISQINYKPDKSEFGISTEQAYVDQLKAKAFELYGEIMEGDKFIEPTGRKNLFNDTGFGIVYNKHSDFLYNENLILYRQGKWATRVPEKVKVEWKDTSRNYISFSYNNSGTNLVHRGHELAEVLEKYLNK
jgi:hypothetical protein